MPGAAKIIFGYVLVLVGGGLFVLSLSSPSALAESGFPKIFLETAPWMRMAGAALALLVGLTLLVLAFRSGLERHVTARACMQLGRRAVAFVAVALTGAVLQSILVATDIAPASTMAVAAILVLVALLAVARLRGLACRGCGLRLERNRVPTSDVKAVHRAMKRDDPTAIGGLIALATSAGPVGLAEIELEWCVGCSRVARVTFGDETSWFVDGDADVVVRSIRQHR